MKHLSELLAGAAARWPNRVAVEAGGDSVTYLDLAREVQEIRDRLVLHGIRPGDRVGLCSPKSLDSLTALYAILEAKATYVPVDAASPLDRVAGIFEDCSVRAVLTTGDLRDDLLAALEEFAEAEPSGANLTLLTTEGKPAEGDPDLAYLLYTSGSTGRPKGVMVTHEAALSFVGWCAQTFDVGPEDRFSSHAPFHFDLSILDLYLAAHSGGTLVLVDEATARQPRLLAPFISERRLSVWYSTPSILTLLVQAGQLERHTSSLRYVLFAGEVFPTRPLRTLTELWPKARYFNLYGPTETNVCTAYEVPLPVPPDQTEPFPIGPACSHVATSIRHENGQEQAQGSEGELCVQGPPVMRGYWNRPERTAGAFHGPAGDGQSWYRTGDIVRDSGEGYVFLGRRDRMVKRRGHRVELGEVEARLHRHPDLVEGAAIAVTDEQGGVRIEAFLCWRDGGRPSLLSLRRFCTEHLPASMIPDRFHHRESLPKTSTDKIDYQSLRSLA